MPKVSVCMPVYNGAKYIKTAIDSIIRQSFVDFELIIVDDCSTDETHKIVQEFKDKRIKYFQNEINKGLVGNWNFCLDNCAGEYIKFIFQDDFLEIECLSEMVSVMDIYKNISLVTCKSDVINENGKKILERGIFYSNRILTGRKAIIKSLLSKNIFGEPSIVMFRKKDYLKIGKFDIKMKYAVDWDYWIRLLTVGDLYYINKKLSRFRISNSSESYRLLNKKQKELIEDEKYLVKKVERDYNIKLSFFQKLCANTLIKIRMILKKIIFAIATRRKSE